MALQEQLTEIFQDVFDDDEIGYNPETSPKDVPAWDSASHVSLILAVEKKFGIKFAPREIVAVKKMGDLFQAVEQKTAKS